MDGGDLGELTGRVEQVLHRIDAQVSRLDDGEEIDPRLLAEILEDDTGELQNLLAEVVETAAIQARAQPADLNRTVTETVRRTLQEVSYPLVIREQLTPHLPAVAWSHHDLQSGIRRVIELGAHHAGRGGEVTVVTRAFEDSVGLELLSHGDGDPHAIDRTATLRDFARELGGALVVETGGDGALRLVLRLPRRASVDDHP